MKKISLTTLTMLILGLFLSPMAAVGAEIKVGYVDVQRAIEETSTGKKAKKELEKEVSEKQKDLEKKKADIQKMQEDLEKKKSVLSEEVRQRKAAELQEEFMKYQQLVGQTEMNIRKREQELTKPIVDKLKTAIEKVAKDKKLDMILHQSEKFQTVLWASDQLDLTDEVIKQYEKLK